MLSSITGRYKNAIREKAIQRTQTRILLAGRKTEDFNSEDLEIIVKEEEDKIKSEFKEKGPLATLALLGISWFG